MSSYWKQSLWIGGIYWIISLVFWWSGSAEGNLIDVGLSVLLLLFLIPMNWLKPIKKIDEAIRKAPIISTFLVSVGWVPYFVGAMFVIGAVLSTIILMGGSQNEYKIFSLFNVIIFAGALRQLIMALTVLAAALSVLVFKKSVAGCLDKHFTLIGGDSCERREVEAPVAASAKSMYACKEAAERHEEIKTEERKAVKPAVKKAVRKTVKKTAAKPARKPAEKAPAKKKTVKTEAAKAAELVKAAVKKKKKAAAVK